MLIVIYDPVCKGYPDGSCEQVVRSMYNQALLRDGPLFLFTGTENIVLVARVMLKRGEFDWQQIQFQYQGEIVPHDKEGRINSPPPGFCSLNTDCVAQLIDWLIPESLRENS